jgi:hypothetical protein
MATKHIDNPIEPMDLANMKQPARGRSQFAALPQRPAAAEQQ